MVTDSARSPLRSVVPPRVVVPLLVALLHLLQGVRRILGRGVGAQPVRAAAAAVPALGGGGVEAEVELLLLAHRPAFLVRQPLTRWIGSVAGDAVDALTQQVSMPVVPGVLLDHVHVYPAQVHLDLLASVQERLVEGASLRHLARGVDLAGVRREVLL